MNRMDYSTPASSLTPSSPSATFAMRSTTTFITRHTVIDPDVSLLEECPICLDDYTGDICLRISGIDGCSHRIGLGCLQEMLGRHPDQEKRCPLCRTIWIAAPVRSETIRHANGVRMSEEREVVGDREDARTVDRDIVILRPRHENTTTRRRDLLSGQRNQPDAAPQRATPSIAAAAAAAMEEYRAEALNFEEFRRDIESVRRRARETSGLGTRRSPREQQAPNRNITVPRVHENANVRAAAGGTANNRYGPIDPQPRQPASLPNSQEGRINTYIRREEINRRLTIARARFGIEIGPPPAAATHELHDREVSVTHVTVRLPAPDTADAAEVDGREAHGTVEATQHLNQTADNAGLLQRFHQREAALAAREVAQTQRQGDLDTREAVLNRREADLIRQESTARDRQQIATRVASLRQTQIADIQRLLAQQKELLESVLRDMRP